MPDGEALVKASALPVSYPQRIPPPLSMKEQLSHSLCCVVCGFSFFRGHLPSTLHPNPSHITTLRPHSKRGFQRCLYLSTLLGILRHYWAPFTEAWQGLGCRLQIGVNMG